jgi:hypothetical protein
MKRICVIGDSHTAALKAGWKTIAGEFADIEITFFAARRELLVSLTVTDGALVSTEPSLRRIFKMSSGGAASIEPRFDRYILCGMGSGLSVLVPLLRTCRPATIPPDARQVLSHACYAACMARVLAFSPMMWMLGQLRQIADAPAALVPQPAPAARPVFNNYVRNGEDIIVMSLFRRAFDSLAEPLGARLLTQPGETQDVSVLTTKPVYFRGGEHLTGNAYDDLTHANAAYGAIVLRHALAALT